MSRKHLSRITAQAYAGNALEYSVDGEPVSISAPLQADASQVPFYYEQPILRPLDGPIETKTRETWISYEVTDFSTGIISYAQSAESADHMAYKLAESHLLRKLIAIDKI